MGYHHSMFYPIAAINCVLSKKKSCTKRSLIAKQYKTISIIQTKNRNHNIYYNL